MSTPENMSSPEHTSGPVPDLDDFLAPIEPRKSRRLLISIVAAVTVLAMVGVAVASILVWTDDADSSQPQAAGNTEITAAAVRYVESVNRGIAAEYIEAQCLSIRGRLANLPDAPPANPQMNVKAVEDVVISGDRATATVSISPTGAPDATPRVDRLQFRNEDGWKYCGRE